MMRQADPADSGTRPDLEAIGPVVLIDELVSERKVCNVVADEPAIADVVEKDAGTEGKPVVGNKDPMEC